MLRNSRRRDYTTNTLTVVTVVVVLRVNVATVEVQVVGVVRITRVETARPNVTVRTYVVKTAIVTVTNGWNK